MEINLELHIDELRKTNELIAKLEKRMSALTDAVNALGAVVADNTTAVNSIPNASDVAAALTGLSAATAQLTANNATLAGDLAPVTPTV